MQTYVSPPVTKQKGHKESGTTNSEIKAVKLDDESIENRRKEEMKTPAEKKESKTKIQSLKKELRKKAQEMKKHQWNRMGEENISKPESMEEDKWMDNDDIDDVKDDFDCSWLEQWVLEMNVDLLTDAIVARNLTEKKQKITERMVVKP